MKRLLPALLAVILLCSCVAQPAAPEQKQYTATFLDVFDTVTTVVGRADSQETFDSLDFKISSADINIIITYLKRKVKECAIMDPWLK